MNEDKIREKLEKRIKALGYDLERVIYTLTIQDVVDCIWDKYYADEDDTFTIADISDNRLNELIENGIDAASEIGWSEVIDDGLSRESKL